MAERKTLANIHRRRCARHAQLRPLQLLILIAALLFPAAVRAADVALVPGGATWRYKDDGSDQGTAWRAAAFDDSGWLSGAAQLGYGDGDELTVVSYGPDPANKYVTTYFRRAFNVGDPAAFTALTLELLRDDGAVVYLNGNEVWRSNMPAGAVTAATLAAALVSGTAESTFVSTALDPALLVAGTNVLAVEIHQDSPGSSDLSFDLRLTATSDAPIVALTRAPYLQLGTPTGVHVRWRTNIATDSRVRYGSSAADLNLVADVPASTTEHEVVLSGLTPATRYYYSVGSTTETLAGGDAAHSFLTAPPPSATGPTRIWVLGDSGTANSDAVAVRNAYYAFAGSTPTNLWLMLGDNAYEAGSDADYQTAVFDMYPTMLEQSVLWPTIGNHDTAQSPNPPASLPYLAMFSLPTAGEAGGAPSGTEKYYSFDYANIHFVCLDSMTSDRSSNGAMLTWLRSDLESTTRKWVIAYWHHPPYSKGSHDSDVDTELTQMRTNALPILEDYGVDLVLSGHSHDYERSYLIDSHYGLSGTFISSMKKDGGSGRVNETGAYSKPTAGIAPHEGAVYAVAGSSGQIASGPLNHPAMFISLMNLGSLVLDVDGDRLDVKFLRENGVVADSFTIIKGPPPAPSALTATAATATSVDLQWTDTSFNEEGFRIERCTGTIATCDGNPAGYGLVVETAKNATTYTDATASGATTYSYRVRAFNGGGASTSGWSNTAAATTPQACDAPSISVQPQSTTIAPGNGTTLSITASGTAPLEYQWFRGVSGDLSSPVQTATFSTVNVAPAATTSYWVRVTNGCGSVNSATATVTVSACSYNVSPLSFSFGASGGFGSITITTSPSCNWSASFPAGDTWISLTSSATGSGNGAVSFSVAANGPAPRSSSITVAGTSVPISQAAAPPGTPVGVNARATGPAQVTITWSAVPGASSYEVERRAAGNAILTRIAATNSFVDNAVATGTSYIYLVRSLNGGGPSASSAPDLATTIMFTDDPLTAGKQVKTVHMTERRNAVNAVRALAGLAPATFTGTAARGTIVTVAQLNELRVALDAALSILGLPTGGYTAIGQGQPIRAVHFQEILNRVK